MKKAQISQNFFIFISALIIASLIIVLGYRSINKIRVEEEEMQLILLEKNLKRDIQGISYGSVEIRRYNVPADVKQICFHSENKNNNPLTCSDCPKSSDYPIVADAITSNASYNVFILGELPYTIELDKVSIGCCEFYCFDKKNGEIELILEGKGKNTLIS